MNFGIDRLLENSELRKPLRNKRVALLAHPASVTHRLVHSFDALAALPDITLVAAFGPQHGLRGDKQDNMVESLDFHDPVHGIPVFSLYGEVRRPTPTMMDETSMCCSWIFRTSVAGFIRHYDDSLLLEAAAYYKKIVGYCRPNPVGRPVEGLWLA